MDQDDYIASEIKYDEQQQLLLVYVRAKKDITVTELQGFTKTLDQFGASLPDGFSKKQFGEGVEIPPEMELEMKVMNETQFRWGTCLPIKSGQTQVIEIPTTKLSSDTNNVLTLAYSYSKFLGVLKGESALCVRIRDLTDG